MVYMFKENRFIFRGKKGPEAGAVSVVEAGAEVREDEGGKSLRKEMSGSVAEDLGGGEPVMAGLEDVDVYKKSLDAMEAMGLGREKCREILEDGTNPFSVWLMDFVERMPGNGWEFDLGATKKQKKLMFRRRGEKIAQSMNNADLIFKWKDMIRPGLESLIERWGGKYHYGNYENAVWKIVVDLVNYPGVRTWLGLATFIRSTDESLELRAMIELSRAAGIETDGLEKELAKLMERRRVVDEEIRDVEDWDKIHEKIREVQERIFGDELKVYLDRLKQVAGSDTVSFDEFDEFKSRSESLMDVVAGRNDPIAKINDDVKALLLDYEGMLASGDYGEDEFGEYFKKSLGSRLKDCAEAYDKAEKDGDYETLGIIDLYDDLLDSYKPMIKKFYNQ